MDAHCGLGSYLVSVFPREEVVSELKGHQACLHAA